MTRGFACLRGRDRHHVVQNNTLRWIGAFPGRTPRDGNTGEVIMYHGGEDILLQGKVDAASWEEITVNIPFTDFPTDRKYIDDILVYVQDGSAKGQTVSVKAVTAVGTSKTKLSVAKWQHNFPKSGAQVVIRDFNREILILNNTINAVPNPSLVTVDFNRTGILLWKAAQDVFMAGNIISHTAQGIRINSDVRTTGAMGRNYIYNNTITDHVAGGPGNKYTTAYSESGNGQIKINGVVHAVGSAFRGNLCADGEFATEIGANNHDRLRYPRNDNLFEEGHENGIFGYIIENNTFNNFYYASHYISTRSSSSLLRNNTGDKLPDVALYREDKVHEYLYLSTWIDDKIPKGASSSGSWGWESVPAARSGLQSRKQGAANGLSQHSFQSADQNGTRRRR